MYVFLYLFLSFAISTCLDLLLLGACFVWRLLNKSAEKKTLDFKGHMDALKRASDSFFLLLHFGHFTFASRISTNCVLCMLFFFIHLVCVCVCLKMFPYFGHAFIRNTEYWFFGIYTTKKKRKNNTERNLKDLFGIISIALMRCSCTQHCKWTKLHGHTAHSMDITHNTVDSWQFDTFSSTQTLLNDFCLQILFVTKRLCEWFFIIIIISIKQWINRISLSIRWGKEGKANVKWKFQLIGRNGHAMESQCLTISHEHFHSIPQKLGKKESNIMENTFKSTINFCKM